ncbi:MAG TPA: LPS export ABC transporter periplasmic protein LptC [Burkholderiaceae bacterium]|nr:LPS export ABC transporter periplasmic protein LptC [Burkholderiaceae bacterium]
MDDRDAVLPIVPLVVRPAVAPPISRPWSQRLMDAVVGYLPVVLMGLLALATWWLVKHTPLPQPERASMPLRHEADYEMRGFSVQRFGAEGPAHSTIEGEVLRHFPDTDTLEIEGVRVLWTDDQGRKTLATARRAVASADGSDVKLIGEAHVVRDPAPLPGAGDGGRVEFRSEYLQVLSNAQRVRTDRPVSLIQGASRLQAGSLFYDHRAGIFELGGRVRGTLAAAAEPGGDNP